ncbi:hypothetical protein [Okeania sp. SIO2C2]|nr:hypothetical protein [Okeania sp. SIO2C2]
MKEPIWIDEIIAKAIHADQIIQHGGSPGIRDENLYHVRLNSDK